MIKVDAMGDTCPIPVVKTKNAVRYRHWLIMKLLCRT